jgi:hypothetical protein
MGYGSRVPQNGGGKKLILYNFKEYFIHPGPIKTP